MHDDLHQAPGNDHQAVAGITLVPQEMVPRVVPFQATRRERFQDCAVEPAEQRGLLEDLDDLIAFHIAPPWEPSARPSAGPARTSLSWLERGLAPPAHSNRPFGGPGTDDEGAPSLRPPSYRSDRVVSVGRVGTVGR